jgi:hypothetical protein
MAQGLVTILRDPMLRTILAAVAICITLALFLVARRRRRLSYLLSDTRVLGIHEAVNPSRVKILFDGAPVTEVRLVMITVNNSGNEPIRVDDFERPLRFSWDEPARIIAAEVEEVNPEALRPTLKAGPNQVVLEPLLLNPGDWLRIKVLINQVGNVSVDGRVVGVRRISKTVSSGKVTLPRTLALLVAVWCVGLIVILVGESWGLLAHNGQAETRIFGVIVLITLFLLVDEVIRQLLARNIYTLESPFSTACKI